MNETGSYVVIATLRAHPGKGDALLEAAKLHAETSLTAEAGCLQFDLIRDPADPDRVVFYEVFQDEDAFAAHQGSEHLKRWRARADELCADRQLNRFTRAAHPRKRGGGGKVLVAVSSLARRRAYLQPLEQAGLELVFNPHGLMMNADQLSALLPGCVATIAGSEPYNDQTLRAANDLKVVARMGVGFDAIDVAAATRHGVAIAMAFGTNHEAVADFAFSMMAALASQLFDYDRGIRGGEWGGFFSGADHGHARLHGTTVGIIGFGRIGRALAKRCQGFGMDVLVSDPVMDAETVGRLGPRLVPLEELLAQADFVSVHAPLSGDTRQLLNADRLGRMKPSAFLVNTARGGMVDEAALATALREGRLAGAGLDVFGREPLEADSPLRDAPNLLMSPHVAGSSEWAIRSMAERCTDSILAVLRGEDPGSGLLLNPEVMRKAPAA